jgi:ATP-dependent phosphoenolpyruvate carboxykinase
MFHILYQDIQLCRGGTEAGVARTLKPLFCMFCKAFCPYIQVSYAELLGDKIEHR